MINSVHNMGMMGIQKAQFAMQKAANEIARGDRFYADVGENIDAKGLKSMAESIVDLKINARLLEASSKLVEVNDEMLGKLLDILV